MKATPSKNQTSDQRLESIQVLRGIAALLVVFCHQIYVGHDHLPPNGWLYWLFESATPIGAFGVDLFFVISGFVMLFSVEKLHGASSAGQFLVGRALRILPIYYLVAGTLFLRGLQAGTDFGAVGFVNSFLLLPLTDQDAYNWPVLIVGWTLVFEFIFYLVVATVVVADVRQRAATIVGITIALPLLGLSLGLEHASAVIVRMITNPILIEFSLGALAYVAWRKGLIERHRATWQLLALVALVSVPLTLSMRDGGVANADELIDGGIGWLRTIGWGSSAALIFLAILTVRSDQWLARNRPLLLLGDISYSLYLVHLPIVAIVARKAPASFPALLTAAIAMLVSIVAALILYRLVERPLHQRSRQWLRRHQMRRAVPATT